MNRVTGALLAAVCALTSAAAYPVSPSGTQRFYEVRGAKLYTETFGHGPPILFLHGTQDEYGDVARLEKLIPLVRNAESVIVTGADHFFTKQIDAVEETMRSWAVEILEG